MGESEIIMQIFDNDILTKFIEKFFGYGNYKGPIWFIGMEPGAPRDKKKIKRFFDVWKDRGEPEIDDVKKSHLDIGIKHYTELFNYNPKYQRTWGGLIKILFYADGENHFSTEDIKKYQSSKLGQTNSDHCLIELLPLPSPGTKIWPYSKTGIKELKDRKVYKSTYLPLRIELIKERIKKYKPKVIVFYSLSYIKHWQNLLGKDFMLYKKIDNQKIMRAEENSILYLVIAQPSQGVSNKYLAKVGELVKQHLEK